MQKSRGQQAMETTRIIPMLFQKGIQQAVRGWWGGEKIWCKILRYRTEMRIKQGLLKVATWAMRQKKHSCGSNTGCFFTAMSITETQPNCQSHLLGKTWGKATVNAHCITTESHVFFLVALRPWAGIPVCQVVWFWSNVLLLLNSNSGRLVFVGMIVKHVEDSHHPSTWAVCQWSSRHWGK